MTLNNSNKIIKITQFNSGLVLKERKTVPLAPNAPPSLSHSSPYKHFTLKKSKDPHLRQPLSTDCQVEIEVKRRDRQFRSSKVNRDDREESSPKPAKILITSKWKFNNEILDLEYFANQVANSQSVVVVRPLQVDNKKETNERAVFGQKKEINIQKDMSKTASCRDRVRGKASLEGEATDKEQTLMRRISVSPRRRISVSPRRRYNQRLEEQKKYQQKLQKEKREILETRREVNKNYAKPFNPPQNVSAFAYIVFEADSKRKPKLNKLSAARKYEQEGMAEIRKLFMHSHKVIVSGNSRTAVEMASLTKIMTCLVAIQISQRFDINISAEEVMVGSFQQNIGGTSANIRKGEIYTVLQLLYGLMLPSGNDASLAVAIWGGKVLLDSQCQKDQSRKWKKRERYERFLAEMNSKALELNMEKTKYCNSHGLCNTENRSCCFDLCILCEYAMNNQLFREIVSCREYECQIKMETEGAQLFRSTQKDTASRESKKWAKKKATLGGTTYAQKNLQLEELKDMEQMQEDELLDDDQPQTGSQKFITMKAVRWENTHQLLQSKPSLYIGIKTGVTTAAGPCLASCFEVKGRRFIVIVLNCKNMKHRMRDTETLRKWLYQKEGIKVEQAREDKYAREQEKQMEQLG